MQGCRRRMFVVEGITSKSEYSEIPMRTLNTLTCSPDIEFMSVPSYLHSADLISENPSSKDKTGEKSLSIHMYVCSLSVPVSVSLCLLVSLSLSASALPMTKQLSMSQIVYIFGLHDLHQQYPRTPRLEFPERRHNTISCSHSGRVETCPYLPSRSVVLNWGLFC